jgi:hypothetical protein
MKIIAVLTGAVRRSSRRSLVDWCAVSGQAPGSGARRQGQGLDEVSTAIHGGAAAVNVEFSGPMFLGAAGLTGLRVHILLSVFYG